MRSRSKARLGAAAAVALGLALAPAAAFADGHLSGVTVLHGIPDTPVDVYVNGDLTLDDFAPGTVTDPLALEPGDYDLAIRGADASADDDPLLEASASVTEGLNASIIAHLDASGSPTITVFANDTSNVAAGEARLGVRHTAAAPAVDVAADGSVIIEDLENPNEAVTTVPAGTYSADVRVADTEDPVIGPADLQLQEGTATYVFAIGSAEAGNLDLLVQTIDGLHSAPDGVPAGDAGLADTSNGMLPVALAALGGAALVAAQLRRRGEAVQA